MISDSEATAGNSAIPDREFTLLGPASLVPKGSMTAFSLADAEILVANIAGEYFGVDNLCSHAMGWLDQGYLHAQSFEVECALHAGRFDLRTGKATLPPCTEPIAAYRVIRRGDNLLAAPPDS